MKIFKWIAAYFNKICSYFSRKTPTQVIPELGKETAKDVPNGDDSEPPAEKKIASEPEKAPQTQPNHKTDLEAVKITKELAILDKKLIKIEQKQKQIEPVFFPQSYNTDKNIEKLYLTLQEYDSTKNLKFSTFPIGEIEAIWQKSESFVEEQTLTKLFQKRETDRVKQFKKLNKEIENLQTQVAKQIAQDDFASAKTSIRNLEHLLKSIQIFSVKIIQGNAKDNKRVVSNLVIKTAELRKKLANRENQIEAERQAKALKIQQVAAEQRRLAEEAKREEENKQREQQYLVKKQQEEARSKKEEEKKQELQQLLVKKSNWQEFAKVLQANGITTLYHFTDRANIDYIKRYGGLFSWQHLRKTGIEVPYEGGGSLSKDLDRRYGLEDFVRVCFTENHPMMYVARNEGRIQNPVILKINTEVCGFQNTKFANMNATRNGHSCGNTLADLQRIKFEVVKQRTHFDLSEQDKPYFQAEVLIKTWIPIEYITNINQF